LHQAWIPAFACLREAEASLRRRQAGMAEVYFGLQFIHRLGSVRRFFIGRK
jgi:hypothetical protein